MFREIPYTLFPLFCLMITFFFMTMKRVIEIHVYQFCQRYTLHDIYFVLFSERRYVVLLKDGIYRDLFLPSFESGIIISKLEGQASYRSSRKKPDGFFNSLFLCCIFAKKTAKKKVDSLREKNIGCCEDRYDLRRPPRCLLPVSTWFLFPCCIHIVGIGNFSLGALETLCEKSKSVDP